MYSYEEIFIERGISYHKAMVRYPNARDEEFEKGLKYITKNSNYSILDLPAGGGYLNRFLPAGVEYFGYDFSGGFDEDDSEIKKCDEGKINLSDESMDVVLSLSGSHHLLDRPSFYREMHRVLKSKGQFILGDVVAGSKVDSFLNDFVDRWNSTGHKGMFLKGKEDLEELERAGFAVEFEKQVYFWNFESEKDAMVFYRDLFFLDKNPSEKELRKALNDLSCQQEKNVYRVEWSLGFLLAVKN